MQTRSSSLPKHKDIFVVLIFVALSFFLSDNISNDTGVGIHCQRVFQKSQSFLLVVLHVRDHGWMCLLPRVVVPCENGPYISFDLHRRVMSPKAFSLELHRIQDIVIVLPEKAYLKMQVLTTRNGILTREGERVWKWTACVRCWKIPLERVALSIAIASGK